MQAHLGRRHPPYPDIEFEASQNVFENEDEGVRKKLLELIDEYKDYKANFVKNIVYNPKSRNLGKYFKMTICYFCF